MAIVPRYDSHSYFGRANNKKCIFDSYIFHMRIELTCLKKNQG